MKKLLVSVSAVATVLLATAAPAFANVVQPNGPGQPTGAYSNPGSTQGQANRSTTGTISKETNDGYRPIIVH